MKKHSNSKKTYTINDIHVPAADSKREIVEYKALLKILDDIDKAKENGDYSCYVSSGGYIPKSIIQKLIDSGYDLIYSYYKHAHSLYVRANWRDGCNGKIYEEDVLENRRCVTIEEMFKPFEMEMAKNNGSCKLETDINQG